jgi:hypothetical protein
MNIIIISTILLLRVCRTVRPVVFSPAVCIFPLGKGTEFHTYANQCVKVNAVYYNP